jgi:hypothetical protein
MRSRQCPAHVTRAQHVWLMAEFETQVAHPLYRQYMYRQWSMHHHKCEKKRGGEREDGWMLREEERAIGCGYVKSGVGI